MPRSVAAPAKRSQTLNAVHWGLLLGVATTLFQGVLVSPCLAQLRPSRANDRNIALLVTSLMDRQHLSEMRVNDEISRRAMEMYLKTLDPMKLYFTQADVDKFASEELRIDDYVREGDVRLARRIHNAFLERVKQRIDTAHRYVDVEHDFSLNETIIRDPDAMTWAASEEEATERWRKRVKYDLLLQIADDIPDEEAREKLHKRYKSIGRRWSQIDNDELLEMFLSALTMSFDPHSSYMSPSTLRNFEITMSLSLDGIGASLESKYGETIVRRIVPGGAADKDGRLQVDDVITGVAQGNDGEMVDIVDMKLTDVVDMIRGKPKSLVRLEVLPSDGTGRKILDITRAHIELKDSEARSTVLLRGPHGEVLDGDNAAGDGSQATGKIIEQNRPDGDVFRIGVINLPSFYMDMAARSRGVPDYKSTTRDVRRLLEEFNRQQVDVAVVDLRFNGGGSLPESVDTTGLFIDRGPVVQVKGSDGHVQRHEDETPGAVWTGPLVVVINQFSASASEIFAGAVQDYRRGIIVGDRATHGKGTVQQLVNLGHRLMPINPPNMGALKITIQQFYRPGGDSTQNRGVEADIEVPWRTSHWEVGEADLDYALKFDRVAPLAHENYHLANPEMVKELSRRSSERIAESEFFGEEQQRIERYLERKDRPTVTLNKEEFLAERAELNTDKEQEKLFDDLQTRDAPVFEDNDYNQEIVAIALDYLELLGDARLAAR